MPASRDGSTPQSTDGNCGGGSLSTNTRSQAINISNGQPVNNSNPGFEHWSSAQVPQVTGYVYSSNMANQEPYTHYYQPIAGHYGIDPSNTWSPFPANYNQPLNSPPGTNPYASQIPAQMFSSDLNYGLQTYNVFGGDYGHGGWSPSIVPQAQDLRGAAKQPQDPYYRGTAAPTAGGYLPTGVDSYSRELDQRMGGMSLGNSNHGGHLMDHHSGFGGGAGGHVVSQGHHHPAPVSNKPLTWADKVKMAPKENVPVRKERPKIGAVSGGGGAPRGGSVWSSGGASVPVSRSGGMKSHSPAETGWTSGAQSGTVTARKPPSLASATNNGRLDQAFKEREGKGPIYLFYSVNASGHFCGVAQMISAVDYTKQSGVWAQDKWKGLFKVKWLYVKDVPNNQLRHIRLENNENKPVTNSRDTQEVHWEKGRGVLKVVHGYKHTTSLFDDFSHYEKRQLEEDQRKKSGDSD